MDDFRRWWASVLTDLANALRDVWRRVSYGIQYDWDVTSFILILGAVVIIFGIVFWRRRA